MLLGFRSLCTTCKRHTIRFNQEVMNIQQVHNISSHVLVLPGLHPQVRRVYGLTEEPKERDKADVPPAHAGTPPSWWWCRGRRSLLSLRKTSVAGFCRAARLLSSAPSPRTPTGRRHTPTARKHHKTTLYLVTRSLIQSLYSFREAEFRHQRHRRSIKHAAWESNRRSWARRRQVITIKTNLKMMHMFRLKGRKDESGQVH